jgi:HEAT repeat protein
MDIYTYVTQLFQASQSRNPDVRNDAMERLQAPFVLEGVRTLLKARRVNDRRQGIQLLRYIATPEAMDLALALIDDRSSNVRLDVMDMLAHHQQRWTARYVVGVMLTDSSSYVRKRAVETLAVFRARETIPHLLEALDADESSYVRYEAARALGDFGDPDVALNLAHALINDDSSYVQYAAAKSLEKLGDRAMIPALFVGVVNENPYVRRAAMKALQAMPDDVALALRDGIFHDDKRVRWLTFTALTVLSQDTRHQLPSWWGVKGALN